MSIEFAALTAEAKRAAQIAANVRKRSWAILRKVSFDTSREVKREMPVDTGRARASWGVWDDHLTTGRRRLKSGRVPLSAQKQMAAASNADSIWDEDEGALSVTQGSNLEYIEPLNEGHSQQAPSGFLDVIADKAALTLADALGAAAEAL